MNHIERFYNKKSCLHISNNDTTRKMSFSILFLFNNSYFLLHFCQLVFKLFIAVTSHHLYAILQFLGILHTLLGTNLSMQVCDLVLKPVNLGISVFIQINTRQSVSQSRLTW